jgi:hypothetical protein
MASPKEAKILLLGADCSACLNQGFIQNLAPGKHCLYKRRKPKYPICDHFEHMKKPSYPIYPGVSSVIYDSSYIGEEENL